MRSVGEIQRAVRSLTPAQLIRLKWYAQWRIKWLGRNAAGRTSENLLSEAMTATMSGASAWREGVDFCQHLLGAMSGISCDWHENSTLGGRLEPEFERPSTQVPGPSDQNPVTLDAVRDVQIEDLETIRKLFAGDMIESRVLDLLAAGFTAYEIRAGLRLTNDEYSEAVRRVRRKLGLLFRGMQREAGPTAAGKPIDLPYGYVCPFCDGRVVSAEAPSTGDGPAVYQWTCRGICQSTFGPPWTDGEAATVLLGAIPWSSAHEQPLRVEWSESRDGERFFVIAEKLGGVWVFSEKSTWESCWYPMKATPDLIAKADSLARPLQSGTPNELQETTAALGCLEYILERGLRRVAVC